METPETLQEERPRSPLDQVPSKVGKTPFHGVTERRHYGEREDERRKDEKRHRMSDPGVLYTHPYRKIKPTLFLVIFPSLLIVESANF